MTMPTISDLRDQPQFFKIVADRIWRTWWEPHGHLLRDIEDGLQEMMKDGPLPFALVAHEKDIYVGSALGIRSDMDERPQYFPWVAAVWVEPEYRLKKVGRTLVSRAERVFFTLGFDRIYLHSSEERQNFYIRLGWIPIEENAGRWADHIVYVKKAGDVPYSEIIR